MIRARDKGSRISSDYRTAPAGPTQPEVEKKLKKRKRAQASKRASFQA
tara:strand:+ start:1094 stop:1237 length:144 start_codon:yes stop_codon:yes gene_type:complete